MTPHPTVLIPGERPAGARGPRIRPPFRLGDAAASIVLLAASAIAYSSGLVLSFLARLAADACTSAACNPAAAGDAHTITVIVLAAVLLVGIATTLIRLRLRRTAWGVAGVTLLAIVAGGFIGAVAFFVALGT